MPPLSALVFRRRSRGASSSPASQRKRRRADVALGHAEPLEPRAMLAVTSIVDPLGAAGWAGAFVGAGESADQAFVSVNAVSSDAANNRYVGGYFRGSVDFDPSVGETLRTAPSSDGIYARAGFVAKFDAAGKFLSVITLDPAAPVGDAPLGGSSVEALAVSGSGKLAIAGSYEGEVDFNPSSGVNKASGGGAFAAVLGTDWSWQNSLITFNDVAGSTSANATHVAFVDNAASSTNTNLFLGGRTATRNEDIGFSNDAFVLKTKFSDADRTDWVKSLGGTFASPAGLAVTPAGVVLTATYFGGLSTIESLAPSLELPEQGGIAISLKSDGTYGAGSWLRTFGEQVPGRFNSPLGLELPAVMPLSVSADGSLVYLATTTLDGISGNASSTIYAIKNSGTGIGSDKWVKTTADLFGTKAPENISAQTLAVSGGKLYVGGTARSGESPPELGLTVLDGSLGDFKGTAVLASTVEFGWIEGSAASITPDGRVLLGGRFVDRAVFPTLASEGSPAELSNDQSPGPIGFVAAVANPFLIAPQFEAIAGPIAGLPDVLAVKFSGEIASTLKAIDTLDSYNIGGEYPAIPITAFQLTKDNVSIPLAGKVVARLAQSGFYPVSFDSQSATDPVVGRTVYLEGLTALTSTPGIYKLSFDLTRASSSDQAKITPSQSGATIGKAEATYTVVSAVTSVSGPKGFAAGLATKGRYGLDYDSPVYVFDAVTDATGLVYVAGSFTGTVDFDPSSAQVERISTKTIKAGSLSYSTPDGFVAVYNANGSFNKVITFPGTGEIYMSGIALDGAGKLIVAGRCEGQNTGVGTFASSTGFVFSLDTASANGAISNLRTFTAQPLPESQNSSAYLYLQQPRRDPTTGAVYIIGSVYGSVTIGKDTVTSSSGSGSKDFVAAFSATASGLAPLAAAAIDPGIAGMEFIEHFDLAIASNGIPVLGAMGRMAESNDWGGVVAGINPATGGVDWTQPLPLAGLTSFSQAFISLAADNAGRVFAGVATIGSEFSERVFLRTVGPSGLVGIQVTKAVSPGVDEPRSSVTELWSKTTLDIGVEDYDGLPAQISVDNAGSVYVSGEAWKAGSNIAWGSTAPDSFLVKLAAADGNLVDSSADMLFLPGRSAYGQFQATSGKFVNFGGNPNANYSVNGPSKTPAPLLLPPDAGSFFSVLSDPFAPGVITTTGSLTARTTTYGTPSSAASFTVKAEDLSAAVTVTAPSGFEVSRDNATFGATTTFAPSGGAVNGTVWVRLAANAPAGSRSGSVTLSSPKASTVAVSIPTSTVSAKALTITGIAIANKEYDGTTAATITGTAAYLGLVNGETPSVAGSPVAVYSDKNVGTGKTVTVSGYTAPSGNYTVTQPTGLKANITAKALTITGVSIANKEYNGNTTATITGTAAYSGLVVGDTFSSVTGTRSAVFSDKNVGVGKTVTVSGFTAPSSNYTVTQPTGLTANITAKALTITGISIANKVYDGTTAATITGTAAYSGLVSGESFTVTGTRTAVFVDANAGLGKAVTVSGFTAPNGNYTVTQPTSLVANITAKGLTITGIAIANKTWDGTTAATITGTAAYVGLVNGETFSVAGGPVAVFADANGGPFKLVTVSGYAAPNPNYVLTAQPSGFRATISSWATIVVSKAEKKATITFDRDVTGVNVDDFYIKFIKESTVFLDYTRISSSSAATYVGNVSFTQVNAREYLLTWEKTPSESGLLQFKLGALNSGIKDSSNLFLGADANVDVPLP